MTMLDDSVVGIDILKRATNALTCSPERGVSKSFWKLVTANSPAVAVTPRVAASISCAALCTTGTCCSEEATRRGLCHGVKLGRRDFLREHWTDIQQIEVPGGRGSLLDSMGVSQQGGLSSRHLGWTILRRLKVNQSKRWQHRKRTRIRARRGVAKAVALDQTRAIWALGRSRRCSLTMAM